VADDIKKVGTYSVLVGTSPKPFWPLMPDTDVFDATPKPQVAPDGAGQNTKNTIVAPPVFAIFDILIKMSDDAVVQEMISEDDSTNKLRRTVSGQPLETSMPLVLESDGNIRICFAIPPNKGNLTLDQSAAGFFEGTLHLEAHYGSNSQKVTLELPLKAFKLTCVDDMFVFFVVHKKASKKYCWLKIKVVEKSNPDRGISNMGVRLKVLRDNVVPDGYRDLNRRVALSTNTDGFVCYLSFPLFGIFMRGRFVLGLPTKWPILFNVDEEGAFFAYVPRGHMIQLKPDNNKTNLTPFERSDKDSSIRIMSTSDADMSTKKVLLDPGHGVVYSYTGARRSNEWYAAHRVADKIASILNDKFNQPEANVFWTRSAGFGLIDPHHIKSSSPETGNAHYGFDLPNKKAWIKSSSLNLRSLSDLLLTRHTGDDPASLAAIALDSAARTRLLTINSSVFADIITRINTTLPAGQHVRPASVRWDPDALNGDGDYVYTVEWMSPPHVDNAIVHDGVHLAISTSDKFSIDDDMVDVLAERSARWSMAYEIDQGLTADTRTAFRNAMRNATALDYMREKIKKYSMVAAPHEWLNHGVMAWGPTERNSYLSATDCDIYLTIHENTSAGIGGMLLLSRLGGNDAVPAGQITNSEIFVKYTDWFDQGLRQGGIVKELADNQAGMLHHHNSRRSKYAYFELEFVDATNPEAPNQFRFEQMVDPDWIDHLACQLVAGIIEILFDPQKDMPPVVMGTDHVKW
jgi:N-acetylmuramoyl-L-alanine amidase